MISTSSAHHQAHLSTSWSDASKHIGFQSAGPSRKPIPLIPNHPFTNMPPPSQIPSTSSSSRPLVRKLLKETTTKSPDEDSSSSGSSSNGADADFEPTPPPKSISTNGNKRKRNDLQNNTTSTSTHISERPAKGKGMSREQLRKVNHSLIERRRREKINAALDQLRSMVPGLGDASGGKGGEFKLEISDRELIIQVLEKTVEHMKELKSYISEMENQLKHLSSGLDGMSIPQNQGISTQQSKNRGQSSTPPTPSLSPERQSPALLGKKTKKLAQDTRESINHDRNDNYGNDDDNNDDDDGEELIDPNETEPEMTLPPPLTLSSSVTSTSSFINNINNKYNNNSFTFPSQNHNHNQNSFSFPSSISTSSNLYHHLNLNVNHQHQQQQHHHNALSAHSIPSSRPIPSAEANNPTLYLPFPTPSPTSPFLTSISGSSSSNMGMGIGIGKTVEPSPFLAPLQGMTLFEGAISLDMTSPIIKTSISTINDKPKPTAAGSNNINGNITKSDSMNKLIRREGNNNSLNDGTKEVGVEKDDQEEAANVLLAFSSPDVMKPTTILNMTPIMKANKEASTLNNHKPRKDIERKDSSEEISRDQRDYRKGTSESEDFLLDDHNTADLKVTNSASTVNEPRNTISQSVVRDLDIGITRGKTAREILQM